MAFERRLPHETDRARAAVKLTIEVPYGDIDAMGHLNNVAYLRYLEWARQKYWPVSYTHLTLPTILLV